MKNKINFFDFSHHRNSPHRNHTRVIVTYRQPLAISSTRLKTAAEEGHDCLNSWYSTKDNKYLVTGIRYCEIALKKDPKNAGARTDLSRMYVMQGRCQEADDLLYQTPVLELRSESPYIAVLEDERSVAKIAGAWAFVRRQEGIVMEIAGSSSQGREYYEESNFIAQNNLHGYGYYDLNREIGINYALLGDFEQAWTAITTANKSWNKIYQKAFELLQTDRPEGLRSIRTLGL